MHDPVFSHTVVHHHLRHKDHGYIAPIIGVKNLLGPLLVKKKKKDYLKKMSVSGKKHCTKLYWKKLWLLRATQSCDLCSGPLGVMVSGKKSTSGAQHPPFRGMGRGWGWFVSMTTISQSA